MRISEWGCCVVFFSSDSYHCHPGYDDMTIYALDAFNDGFPTNDIHTDHLMLPTRQPVHSIPAGRDVLS